MSMRRVKKRGIDAVVVDRLASRKMILNLQQLQYRASKTPFAPLSAVESRRGEVRKQKVQNNNVSAISYSTCHAETPRTSQQALRGNPNPAS